MVHIELCHPNMEVKIIESRVREQDFYRDLNSSEISSVSSSTPTPTTIPTMIVTAAITQEPQVKKQRCSNHYDSESAPINGVAISLKTIVDDDENESLPASDDTSETENLEPVAFGNDEHRAAANLYGSSPTMVKPSLKLKLSSPHIPIVESTTSTSKDSDSDGKRAGRWLASYELLCL